MGQGTKKWRVNRLVGNAVCSKGFLWGEEGVFSFWSELLPSNYSDGE